MSPPRTVGIVTDSTADIPTDIVERHDIQVVPALLSVDSGSFKDGEEMSRAEFYRRMPDMETPPTTAVPSTQSFQQAYQTCFDRGAEHVLALLVSSRLSGMYDTATLAAQAFDGRVRTFDSRQISLGLGFQVIEAAQRADQGGDLDAVLAAAKSAQERVEVIAMINSLEYLRRSGRVSWLQAGVSEILRIKLLIGLEDGGVVQVGRARTRRKAIQLMMDIAVSWGPLEQLAVLHSGIPDEGAEIAGILQHLAPTYPRVVDVTTIIGAHVGPQSIGLAALRK